MTGVYLVKDIGVHQSQWLHWKTAHRFQFQNKTLPVVLPEDVVMDGASSPIKSDPEWAKITINGQAAFKETDTFDTFMESSWYYARYCSPQSDDARYVKPRASKLLVTCRPIHRWY